MSAAITPTILPVTWDQYHAAVPGASLYGNGNDIFGKDKNFFVPLQPVLPRKIFYFSAFHNVNQDIDVRFRLSDGQELPPWQVSMGGQAAPSNLQIRWGHGSLGEVSGSDGGAFMAGASNIVWFHSARDLNARHYHWSTGLHFVTSANQIIVNPLKPNPAYQGTRQVGNNTWYLLWKIVEFPLGSKLHTKLFR